MVLEFVHKEQEQLAESCTFEKTLFLCLLLQIQPAFLFINWVCKAPGLFTSPL